MQQEATGSISADLTTLSLAEALQKLEQREATGRLEVDGPSGERIRFRLWEGRLVHAESGLDNLDPTRSGWIHPKESNEDMADTEEVQAVDRIVHALASALRFPFGQLRFRPEDTSSPWNGVHPALALAKAARMSRKSKESTPP